MFSLVVSTIGRKNELERLFESLENQIFKEFEVVIVDQNKNLVDNIISRYSKSLNINHLKVSPRGASSARNTGLKVAKNEIITFPDDDCWYGPNVLDDIKSYFEKYPRLDLLTCRTTDGAGVNSHANFRKSEGVITKFNSVLSGIEFTIFLKKKIFDSINGFDEMIGPGAGTRCGAGEAYDFLLKVVAHDFNTYFTPNVVIFHEVPFIQGNSYFNSKDKLKKLKSYAFGFSYVLKKHKFPFWYFAYYIIRSVGGIFKGLITLSPNEATYHYVILKGRLEGWTIKL